MVEPLPETKRRKDTVTLFGREWSLVGVAVVWCLGWGLLVTPGVHLAQARWNLPGLAIALGGGFGYAGVFMLAFLAWTQQRQRRVAEGGYQVTPRPLEPGGRGGDGCATFLWLYLALMVLGGGSQGLQRSGVQRLDNMAPVVAKGETWMANRWSYRWHAPQIGDVVAFPWHWFQPGRPMQTYGIGRIVSLGGESLAWREGRVCRTTGHEDRKFYLAGAGALPDVVFVPQGTVAVMADRPQAGDYSTNYRRLIPPPPPPLPGLKVTGPQPAPWSRPPETPFGLVRQDALVGKVVAVTNPLWRMRSVH